MGGGESSKANSESRSRRARGHVTVFAAWCKGCGICIEFCPRDVFEVGPNGEPLIARPEDCTACGWCEVHCPDMAIVVRRLDEDDAAELDQLQDLADKGVLPSGGDS